MSGKAWTARELETLRDLKARNVSNHTIAERLGRTVNAVMTAASVHGFSKPRRSSKGDGLRAPAARTGGAAIAGFISPGRPEGTK